MSSNNQRILIHTLMPSGGDPEATKKAHSTFLRINNILMGNGQLPNISKICDYCEKVNKKLGAYIRNWCFEIRKADTIFEPNVNKPNSILNIIGHSDRKKIRIILYPGNRNDIDGLNLSETTHNMIVQFDRVQPCFKATDPHGKSPSFYQVCNSEETALLYLEGLIVDACICHYLGVSDVAFHHDDKQRISSEKVIFLRELVEKDNVNFLSPGAQKLVNHVVSQLHKTTPYISFLSVFTIAPMDLFKEMVIDCSAYFEDYFNLWSEFQKWYFDKHHRLFSKAKKVENPLKAMFDRSKYFGQISELEITNKINDILKKPADQVSNDPFGMESRYAVVIIKHMPNTYSKIQQFKALFSGELHQAKWDIIYWGEIERYDSILSFLEVVPFMISEDE